MSKIDKQKIFRLERLLEAERARAELAWDGYRKALIDLVDAQMKLKAIAEALQGEAP